MKRKGYLRQFAPMFAIFLVTTVSAFAKESRKVNVAFPASLGGTAIAPGEYNLQWKSHGPDATVTLMKGKKVVTTAHGQVLNRDTEYDRNAVVYDTGSDGSRTIIELRFADSKRVLVFGNASSEAQGSVSTPAPATESAPATPAAKPGASGDKTSQIRFLGKPTRNPGLQIDPQLDSDDHVVRFKEAVFADGDGAPRPNQKPMTW